MFAAWISYQMVINLSTINIYSFNNYHLCFQQRPFMLTQKSLFPPCGRFY